MKGLRRRSPFGLSPLLGFLALLLAPFAAQAQISPPAAGGPVLPSFLKAHYAPLLKDGKFVFKTSEESPGRIEYRYEAGLGQSLTIARVECRPEACVSTFELAVQTLDNGMRGQDGEFQKLTGDEASASWRMTAESGARGKTSGKAPQSFTMTLFRMPQSIQVWTLGREPPPGWLDRLRLAVNRDRYEEMRGAGIADFSPWSGTVHAYYKALLDEGRREEAVAVLKDLVAVAPQNFEAQLDFAEFSPDKPAGQASLKAVLANAEDPALLKRASALAGVTRPDIASLPVVEASDKGLQVVLIPLGNADVGLLQDAAKIYETMTGIPVKLRRLPQPFLFGAFDRMASEAYLQRLLTERLRRPLDFTGWDLARYEQEYLQTIASTPRNRFKTRKWFEFMAAEPRYYSVEAYMLRLADLLRPIRSPYAKVIYVGITDATLFSGDGRVYETTGFFANRYLGIMGYGPMGPPATNETFQSRRRLAERIAKELAPASLKGLDIPRPVDPGDPYSLSGGFDRLNQKTLELSQPTRDAIAALKAQE